MAKKKRSSRNISSLSSRQKKLIVLAIGVIIVIILASVLIAEFTKAKVTLGDTVTLNYIGTFDNGTIFDTNIEEAGKSAGLQKPSYEAFTFAIGQIIPGFEDEIIGMSLKEKKKFRLTADRAYGEFDEKLVIRGLEKKAQLPKYTSIDLKNFKSIFKYFRPYYPYLKIFFHTIPIGID